MADKLEWVGDVLWDAAGAPVAVLRTVDRKPPGPDSRWSYTVHGHAGSRGEYATREAAMSAVERFLAGEAPEPAAEPPAAKALRDRVQERLDEVRKEIDLASQYIRLAAHDLREVLQPLGLPEDEPISTLLQVAGFHLHFLKGQAAALEEVLRELDGKEEA